MRTLTLIKTLEYYDVPQIIVTADTTDTNYLCTLYQNNAENGYLYLGVQISENRLAAFEEGQLDLRDAYTHPEADSGLYLVAVTNGVLNIVKSLPLQDINEEMLPVADYSYSIT